MTRSDWTRLFSVLVSLTALTACDDDDDTTGSSLPQRGTPTFVQVVAPALATLEGLVTKDNTPIDIRRAFKRLPPAAGVEYGPRAGRLVVSRGVYTFNLAAIPPNAHIESARLHLFQVGVVGTPYDLMERIVVDHIDTTGFAELDPSMFDGATLEENFGMISEDPLPGFKSLDVTEQVHADHLAGRRRSSFRVRGESEKLFRLEGVDEVTFTDSLDEFGDVPELDILYAR